MTNRDVEYIALSRDTTEADLKQRREIRSGFTKYFDQVPSIDPSSFTVRFAVLLFSVFV